MRSTSPPYKYGVITDAVLLRLAHLQSLLLSQEDQACPAGEAAETMLPPSSLEEPWASSEPHMPPGLNAEQAWAWALDNFGALSSHSCQCPESCADVTSEARALRRESYASLGARPTTPVRYGQKRCWEPDMQESMSKITEDIQTSHQAQPGDGRPRGAGQNQAQSKPWNPTCPWKMLKTKAVGCVSCEDPGKEASPSLEQRPRQAPLQPVAWMEPTALMWGPAFCPCGLLHWNCALHTQEP